LPDLDWQPSDPDPDALVSIAAWSGAAGLANIRPPIAIDAASADWPVDRADAMLCINMAHISPWEATAGLLRAAERLLPSGAPLVLYGPWVVYGRDTAASNIAFDRDLRNRNPLWGLRRLEDLVGLADAHGFDLAATHEMPANNLTIVLRRRNGLS